MLQGRDHPAYFIDPSGVDLSHNKTRLFSPVGQDPSPRVDHKRVTISSPTIRAHPALARRKDITAGLDGAGAHEDMPVCFPGSPGKGCGDREISGTGLGQGTVEIGKAHVITDAKTESAPRCSCHHGTVAGLDGGRFPIALTHPQADIEAVQLVAAGHDVASSIEQI